MKKIGIYLIMVLIITIIVPTVIVKAFNISPRGNMVAGDGFGNTVAKDSAKGPVIKENTPIIDRKQIETIRVFNSYTDSVSEIDLEDYVKGVVAAEMPAEFHIEALKAQAVAARTYAMRRTMKYPNGHPDHMLAPICRSVHCQAYLTIDELRQIHGDSWMDNYWPKIEEAVDSTKDLLIYYKSELADSLYHSTSGGMTEDAINVFAMDAPYLKSVSSPYEEGAPKFKTVTTLTADEFVNKINSKYPEAKLNKTNFLDKIKLVERTGSGRIKKLAIHKLIIDGRELRELFSLNSTNFTISYDQKIGVIDIVTYGYGHGVGMSQWGANGMANNGSSFIQILKHYYTDIEIK